MQNTGIRFLLSVLIVLGGIIFIVFSMEDNGSADPRNPAWKLFGGFLDFKAAIIKGVLYLAGVGMVAGFSVVVAMAIFSKTKAEPSKALSIEEKDESFSDHLRFQGISYAKTELKNVPRPTDFTPPANNNLVSSKSTLNPVPREITPEEPKKKPLNKLWAEDDHDFTITRSRNFIVSSRGLPDSMSI